MAFLAAKDVRSIEDRFYELLFDAHGTKEDKQAFFQRRMKILVPKTNYEIMWERLVERLGPGGAGEAVFDYVLYSTPPRLQQLLDQASRGETVRINEGDLAVVKDLFWGNGKLRRIGQHFVEYMVTTGKGIKTKERRMGKEVTERPTIWMPEPFRATPTAERPEFFGTTLSPGSPVQKLEYDVALSFAGEQRGYVSEVAEALRSKGVRVFYDEFERVRLWGKNLQVYLEEVYRKRARLCVIFLSEDYMRKAWPLYEGESALARALVEPGEYILPVRFDDAELPGLMPTISYLDAREFTPKQLTDMIEEKLRQLEELT
jgi:hypothetical protein